MGHGRTVVGGYSRPPCWVCACISACACVSLAKICRMSVSPLVSSSVVRMCVQRVFE